MVWWAALPAAYLLGSIPTGLWVGRALGGVDVRTMGSRRTGATNVQRTMGTGAGLLVLLIDAGKGAAAVLVVRAVTGSDLAGALAGVAAVLGHIWPLWAGFRGGRGAATAAGAMAAMTPLAFLGTLAVMAVVVFATRYVSLGSILAAVAAPIWVAALRGPAPEPDAGLVLALAVGTVVLARHADNLHRLLHGRESKLGAARAAPPEPARQEL
jgi:glycerol-3-phosphate acyltransferase PlsY